MIAIQPQMPKVSILIPVFNRKDYIAECIQSALNQTYPDFEIIVVDNASTENTFEIVQAYAKKDSRIRLFRNETNLGPVRNWARCIHEAKGEYGKILWSDDLIAPEFLSKTVGFLRQNEDVGFVFTGTEFFNCEDNIRNEVYFIGETGIYPTEKYIQGIFGRGGYPLSPGCALFRLKDLKGNLKINIPNKLNSDFSMHAIGNDLLIYLLTAHEYKYFAFVRERLSFFREHQGCISICATSGKLQLHYDLAMAWFAENLRSDLIGELNCRLFAHLRRFPASKDFGMRKISDFYLVNKNYKISITIILKRGLWKLIRSLRYNLKVK